MKVKVQNTKLFLTSDQLHQLRTILAMGGMVIREKWGTSDDWYTTYSDLTHDIDNQTGTMYEDEIKEIES